MYVAVPERRKIRLIRPKGGPAVFKDRGRDGWGRVPPGQSVREPRLIQFFRWVKRSRHTVTLAVVISRDAPIDTCSTSEYEKHRRRSGNTSLQ